VVALKLIEHCGPLTATSANVHGGIEPTIIESARIQLKDNVDIYIDGGRYRGTKGSTVIDLSGKKPKILRDGLIPAKCLEVDLDAA
jgi:tRNA A37 threonylcarbamoyladenosine synthetase subunit TsaC/SUA5/YrdC